MQGFKRGALWMGVVLILSACASKKTAVLEQPRPVQVVEIPNSSKDVPEIVEVSPEAEVVMPSPKEFVAGVDGKRDEFEFVGTVNFNLRKPDFVIIHHTAQESVEQTIRTFSLEHTQVSAHYLVGKDGKVYQLLNDYLRAWHAGNSRWGKVTDMNSHSIGIELDNNGDELFPPEQISSLLNLLDSLKANYRIPTENFIGHSDIAPTRKQDPSVHFPWKILSDRGFGIWYDPFLSDPPANFDPIMALRVIGYDTRNPRAAIIAFKRHFIQYDISEELTAFDLQVLFNLMNKQL